MIEFKAWQRAELYDTTHDAMVSLVEWCTGTIPFSFDFVIDHHAEVATRPLDRILFDLSEMRSGCMCGGLSKLMAQLARREGFDAVELNFGDPVGRASHVVVLVDIGEGRRVIYDPTFCAFSAHADGAPASIDEIIALLEDDRGSDLRWVGLRRRERVLLFRAGAVPEIPIKSIPRALDERRMLATIDLDMFSAISFGAIWHWARPRTAYNRYLFDILRFPIGTSGESPVEAIAERLRALQ